MEGRRENDGEEEDGRRGEKEEMTMERGKKIGEVGEGEEKGEGRIGDEKEERRKKGTEKVG